MTLRIKDAPSKGDRTQLFSDTALTWFATRHFQSKEFAAMNNAKQGQVVLLHERLPVEGPVKRSNMGATLRQR